MIPWYDDAAEMTKALDERGIAGLHELVVERHHAGYDRDERMREWCLLGRFRLDTCGNFMRIEQGAPIDCAAKRHLVQTLMLFEDALQIFDTRMVSEVGVFLPPVEGVCVRCLDGWTLANVSDYHLHGRQAAHEHRHRSCHRIAVIQEEMSELSSIAAECGVGAAALRFIPNQYCPCEHCGPWVVIATPLGAVRMGWRKRVIHIDWEHSTLASTGKDVAAGDDVTTSEQLVHAWGRAKAVEYLRRLLAGSVS